MKYTLLLLSILSLAACGPNPNTPTAHLPETSRCENLTIAWQPPASDGWDASFVPSLPREITASLSQEELAAALFCQYLEHAKTPLASPAQAITEYRVHEIQISATEGRVVAQVSFSVKPEDMLSTAWIAGNGIEVDGWVASKLMFIGVMEEDTTYTMELLGTLP